MDSQKKLANFIEQIKQQEDFEFIDQLLEEFPDGEVFLVGGAVRDIVLDIPDIQDFDFVVRNVTPEQLETFLAKLGVVNLVGKRFGVFKFRPINSELSVPLDIALPRTEHALLSGGYRDFEVQTNPALAIESDLSRRDFTINAMAWDFKNQQLIDPFNGLVDLTNRTIKAVGEIQKRFKEDYSRMLRALRFACQLDFIIEPATQQAIIKNIIHLNDKKDNLRIVPYEVIAQELLKALVNNPVKTFDLFETSGVWQELMPEILRMKGCPQPTNWHSEGDVWTHTRLCLEKLFSTKFKKQFGDTLPDAELILAVLFHDIGKPYTIQTPEKNNSDRIRFNEHDRVGGQLAETICQRLKLSSAPNFKIDPEKIKWLVGKHLLFLNCKVNDLKNRTIEKYFFNPQNPGNNLLKLTFVDALATIPAQGEPDLTNFYQALDRIARLKILSANRKDLPKELLSGDEIMTVLNIPPGPQIGKIKELIREKQLLKELKNKNEAEGWLKNLNLEKI